MRYSYLRVRRERIHSLYIVHYLPPYVHPKQHFAREHSRHSGFAQSPRPPSFVLARFCPRNPVPPAITTRPIGDMLVSAVFASDMDNCWDQRLMPPWTIRVAAASRCPRTPNV